MKLKMYRFWQKMINHLKNTIKFGIKSVILSEKNLIVIWYTIKKYLRATIKSYNGNINTNFHNNNMSKEDSQLICLVVILIDSAFRAGKNYF